MVIATIPDKMVFMLAAVMTALFISYMSIPVIIRIAEMKRLTDEPDGKRKIHQRVIPTLGGIGIFSAFMISFSVWGRANDLESYPFFVAALFMLFLIGIKDDVLMLSPIKKLGIQVLSAALVVIGGNLIVNDLYGVLGIHKLPYVTGVLFSIFLIIVIINAFNLIDGIDGLAGGIGIISSVCFGIWFWGVDHISLAVLSFVLAGSLIGFLVFNFSPAKIFMGDTGSMVVGFILAYLVIHFIDLNQTVGNMAWRIHSAPVIAFAFMVVPLFDTMRVFAIRTFQGNPPFQADCNHIHHRLLSLGLTHRGAAILLWCANLIIILLAVLLRELECNILLIIVLSLSVLILPVVHYSRKLYGHFKTLAVSLK